MCIHKITGASYLIDTTARNTPLDHSHTVTQRSVRTLTNRWLIVGPTSQTLAQHLASDLHKRLPKSPYSGAGLSDKAESGRWPSSKPRLSPPSLAPSILKFICHTTDGLEIILPVFRRLVCPPAPPPPPPPSLLQCDFFDPPQCCIFVFLVVEYRKQLSLRLPM